jgi:ankyrin repeat protein
VHARTHALTCSYLISNGFVNLHLSLAAAFDGNFKLVECMVLMGVDVNYQDEDGKTALTVATEEFNYGIAHYLLAQGARCTNVELEDYFIAACGYSIARVTCQ